MASFHVIIDSFEMILRHLLLTGMIFLVDDMMDEAIDIASHSFLVTLITIAIFFALREQLAQQRKTAGKRFGTYLLIFGICTHGININPKILPYFVQI